MPFSPMRALGRALRPLRPGPALLATSRLSRICPGALQVRSPAFADKRPMPVRFTADGDGLCPPLAWDGLPPQTRSCVLLVEDADIPSFRPFVHLIVHAIPPSTASFAEGEVPTRLRGHAPGGWACGRNSVGRTGWLAPSPPPGHGPHRYAFQVFALDTVPAFRHPPGRALLLRTIRPHLLAQGRMVGTYERR